MSNEIKSKSKLTLIIDGNWLLMSRMSVLNKKYADTDELCNALQSMMIKSINVVLRQFPIIDNIIFVADGGSWRNHIDIPTFLLNNKLSDEAIDSIKALLHEYSKTHDINIDIDAITADTFTLKDLRKYDIDIDDLPLTQLEYKGNREKSPDIDWDSIFASYENFIGILQQSGINVCKEPGIEGDDWAWYWSSKLNAEGTNCIIWSRDKDLTQLVRTDANYCFTICWNKEFGVTCEETNDDDMAFFFNPTYAVNAELFSVVCSKSKEVAAIKPANVVIDKVIRGDAGDNIQPLVLRKAKSESSNKLFKVSEKDIDWNMDIHDDAKVREYFVNLLSSKNYIGRVMVSVNQAIEHFKYNVRLVELASTSYPEEILEKFNEYDSYTCNTNLSEAEYEVNKKVNAVSSIIDFI